MKSAEMLKKLDKVLLFALFLGLVFCIYGINWGWVEEWNPDQMGFKELFQAGKLPFNPESFQKPPFHTYFVYFLSVLPFELIGNTLHLSADYINPAKLLWSRMLTVFLFLGSIILVYQICKRFFGVFPARLVTIIFATSAGFISFSHFLTTEIPVMFWMLLSFYFAQNILLYGKLSDYVLAGFCTGIATATKYNGLAIGMGIVVAHVLSLTSRSWRQWKKSLFDKKLIIGLSMVVIGFLVCNPFALLDYSTFWEHFWYNYIVTPVYGGIAEGNSFGEFVVAIQEIIGFPSWLVFLIGFLFCFYSLAVDKEKPLEQKGIVLLFSLFLLYYFKFGSFPRMETRFVMPIVPFGLIISGVFWNKIKGNRRLMIGLLLVILSYNLICSFYVGKRFTEDPRMVAQEWVKTNIEKGSSIESSAYSPQFNKIPEVILTEQRMPDISGRKKKFSRLFKDNPWIMARLQWSTHIRWEKEDKEEDTQWYTLERLIDRKPDYIAVNSRYYNRFIVRLKNDYPSLYKFFSDLLEENYPYHIVFDRESPKVPGWIYPKTIDFIQNRMVIFAKNDLTYNE
ncbi:MAG: phospholipid carrier-dependent glycosyltransferase [Moorea sp. SIOASIH]|uniref:ArnT family glycosyltransferase n=1 Tax=Moorena sp. SIOASIH TaxID=2607817 RepID=UPI0013B9AA5C|nr:phospholipid carrier-dependent glycosyltransferase [Moorena sp. SIOASIH]NEO37862.1 phospholipid carrier-dependent glycosyltransferase [Moorena sp. SIOASIH]